MAKFGNTQFQPRRLTQAREWLSMTKRTLARLTDLTEQAIGNYEAGRNNPTDPVITVLANALNMPERFFTSTVRGETPERVFWRKMQADTVQSQRRTSVLIEWAVEAADVLQDYVEFHPLELPEVMTRRWDRRSMEDIEEIAENVRSQWRLGRRPIADLTLVIENAGIPVFLFDVESHSQSGFMYHSRLLSRPVIGVNTYMQSLSRQRFSLAHELGHTILHTDVTQSEMNDTRINKEIENQANRFAAALLFPREAFAREAFDFSLEEFATLKRTWGVGVLAQIMRAYHLGLIDDDRKDFLFRTAGRRGYRKPCGEPWDNELPLEAPRFMRRGVEAIEAGSTGLIDDLRHDLVPPLDVIGGVFDYMLERRPLPDLSNVVTLRSKLS